MVIKFDEEKQGKNLRELKDQDEELLAQTLATKYGLSYQDLTIITIDTEAMRLVDEKRAREAFVAPFSLINKRLSIGVLSPQNDKTLAIINELKEKGYTVTPTMVSTNSLEFVWARYKDLSFSFENKAGSLDISNEEIAELLKNVHTVEDVKTEINKVLALKKGHVISKILEIMLTGALATGASDLHLEPEELEVRLRYRLDGVLQEIVRIKEDIYGMILSRIKLLSGLKLNLRGVAQDGRFSIKAGEDEIEIRVSVLPGAYNDSVVMRVLNPKSIGVPLESMGIDDKLFAVIEKQLKKPNGMILTTGPTGSGKTTTLYAFLKKIYSSEIKILTIENPVEYHLAGITQTQTDAEKGYTFLSGLRAALRQDPDVIMVGEIRDDETAEIAVNAALTGHLVFSTLHTNNAAGTFPRLIDLGVNPKILASALSLSLAQRLVRKLCPDCRKEVLINNVDKERIAKIVSTITDKSVIPNTEKVFEAVGCSKCNNTGYKGRIGIFEAIVTDETIEKILTQNPSEREIKKAAEHQGLYTLQQDGIIKVLNGKTSIDELERVVDLDEI